MSKGSKDVKKILIADDSELERKLLSEILRSEEFQVLTVCNGQEAVEAAAREKPDIILLDVRMPVMGGFEACRAIHKAKETAQIPVVMITVEGDRQKVEKGYESGCCDYVMKPFSAVELVKKIRILLGLS